jgi:hypothetical protein
MLAWATDPKVGHGLMNFTRHGGRMARKESGRWGNEREQAKRGGDICWGIRGEEQGHQESNLDPSSRDNGAPTPPDGYYPKNFIVLCAAEILRSVNSCQGIHVN